jgi:hypothetical protein
MGLFRLLFYALPAPLSSLMLAQFGEISYRSFGKISKFLIQFRSLKVGISGEILHWQLLLVYLMYAGKTTEKLRNETEAKKKSFHF